MKNENGIEKKNILEWYGSKREKMLGILIVFAAFVSVVFLLGIFVDVDAGFITGKPGMPEFDEFYMLQIWCIRQMSLML